jgi:protein-tyrosine phosphatase
MTIQSQIETLQWVTVGAGKLTLHNRPKRKLIPQLAGLGCSRVVTLLSEREGGKDIGALIQAVGLAWTWLPLPNAHYPEGATYDMLLAALPILSGYLDNRDAILIHCSAGIHRTGMAAYGLLRWRGYTQAEARAAIAAMRGFTAQGMQPHHFAWGDAIAGNNGR